jgi:hypothetical protein
MREVCPGRRMPGEGSMARGTVAGEAPRAVAEFQKTERVRTLKHLLDDSGAHGDLPWHLEVLLVGRQ